MAPEAHWADFLPGKGLRTYGLTECPRCFVKQTFIVTRGVGMRQDSTAD